VEEVQLLDDAISSIGHRLTGEELAKRGGNYRLVNRKDLLLRVLKTLEVFVEDRVRQTEDQLRGFLQEREKEATEDGKMRVLASLADLADLVDSLVISLGGEGAPAGAIALDKRMDRVFKSYSFERIKTVGSEFDPALHEMLDGRAEEGANSGTIIEEISRGYHREGFVLRVARVVVAE
tara:strand:- start:8941 stop:9477 length:537 start_codon:yes stop_codon:yes gene_type:complete